MPRADAASELLTQHPEPDQGHLAPGPRADGASAGGSLTTVLARWASGLRHGDLPGRISAYATSQLISHLAVVRAGMAHPLGQKLVKAFGPPTGDSPDQAAYVLAALSSCLYYEDSMYVGHVSHSTVGVPLAYRREQRLTGERLLAAMVAANECAARVTAASTLGPFRGQTAAHAQLVGAVAAKLHGAGAPVSEWTDAWGLALAAPPWSLRRAFLGSDAKVLSASVPVRVGLDACRAAAAGLTGAEDILEHPGGLLAKVSEVPTPEVVTAGLGTRWHTETLSFKVHPAGAYVDAAIDCASELHDLLTPAEVDGIDEIVVRAARLTMVMDREAHPYLDRERSAILALNLSVAYNVATALLTGAVTTADLAEPATADPVRWALAAKVRLEYDPELSRGLLSATAPLGEALRQAEERAEEWFTAFSGGRTAPGIFPKGRPSSTFEDATKAIGSRVEVTLRSGRRLRAERTHALGSAGAETRRNHRRIALDKLAATGAPTDAMESLRHTASLGAAELDAVIRAVLSP
ncbi:MmgE/PrpD family protein [Streptomyces sp. NPDC006446]|uniref:MmgE/PrpD family protein n=1 Tax=Streptomyces sp. NPDC006446 TaxID=3154301 RepID=UPI0033A3C700